MFFFGAFKKQVKLWMEGILHLFIIGTYETLANMEDSPSQLASGISENHSIKNTIDGRNPANPLGCIKPCKYL